MPHKPLIRRKSKSLSSRVCKCGCNRSFQPYRSWQLFFSPDCRSTFYETRVRSTEVSTALTFLEAESEKIAGG